jgi:hypothetical protein
MSEENEVKAPQQQEGEAAQQQQEKKPEEVPWWRNHPWLGRHLFMENRNKNCELLLKYDGMHVAWFPDGSGIRDADVNGIALFERIKASGDDPEWYVYEEVMNEPQL